MHTVLAGLFLAWLTNVNKIQKAWEADDTCTLLTMHDFGDTTEVINGCDANFYDIGFSYPREGHPFTDMWTDLDEANDLIDEIIDDGCGLDCIKQGCRWSIIYSLCGITMLLIATTSALNFVGTWYYHFRFISSCCTLCLCILNLSAIIVTGVFRFNTIG